MQNVSSVSNAGIAYIRSSPPIERSKSVVQFKLNDDDIQVSYKPSRNQLNGTGDRTCCVISRIPAGSLKGRCQLEKKVGLGVSSLLSGSIQVERYRHRCLLQVAPLTNLFIICC
jgi:hypothetical protein